MKQSQRDRRAVRALGIFLLALGGVFLFVAVAAVLWGPAAGEDAGSGERGIWRAFVPGFVFLCLGVAAIARGRSLPPGLTNEPIECKWDLVAFLGQQEC